VVAEHEAALRIEVRAPLGKKPQGLVRREDAVLDLAAAGERRRAHALRAVGVHERAQVELPRLAARRVELLLAHRLRAAFPDALRREELDQIGPGRGALPDRLAQLRG